MKKKYICWYAYSGHETEGRLSLEEPMIFEAESVAEAMWNYHERLGNPMSQYYKSFKDYSQSDTILCWGYYCKKLADGE